MNEVRMKKRILSAVLAFLMTVSLVPVSAFASTATYADAFTVCVTGGDEDAKLDGASVDYTIEVDGTEGARNTVTTTDGEAVIQEMADYAQDIADGKAVTLAYTVSAEGYDTVSDRAAVTDVTGNVDVKLTVKTPDTVNVTVTKTGNGLVRINDQETETSTVEKGGDVKLELIPAKGAYIQELTVKGEPRTVKKGETFQETLTADEDITVSVTFAQEYTVTVTADKGGKVLLDGEAVTEKTYKEGTEVELSVAADDDYQIESIAIDGTQEDIADTASFTKKLTVDKDTTIAVKFIRVYTVTVTYDSQHGTVETDPAAQGGEVEAVLVKQGSTLTIKATPNENYRVSEVEIDGKAESFDDNRYVKDTPFTRDIKNITAPHTIKITFAPTLQTITVISGKHGTVKVEGPEKVSYNDSVDLIITPKDGYIIDTITVDEADVKANVKRATEKSYKLSLTKVQRDTEVAVTFTECPQIGTTDLTALDGITWNSGDAIRRDGATFVFAKNAAVQFSAAADETGIETGIKGIQLIFADGTTSGGYDAETASFTQPAAIRETKTIQAIRVFYGETEIRVAQLANPEEKLEGLKIVVDTTDPKLELALEAANTNGYYNKSFTVKVNGINDPDDYSGIQSVEYWVVKDRTETEQGTETQREMLYTYTEGGDILQELGDCTFTVDAGKNNSDNVVIYVQVTDRAGNVSKPEEKAVKINSTSPTIEIEFGKEKPVKEKPVNVVEENGTERGYYKAARTATVTITDRASTLDLDAVKFDIKDTAGKDVSDTATISVWGKDVPGKVSCDVTFSGDANYIWSISYTNRAGLSAIADKDQKKSVNATTIGETPYCFTVDKNAPTGTITANTYVVGGKDPTSSPVWEALIDSKNLAFGVWANDKIVITHNEWDETSPIKSKEYFVQKFRTDETDDTKKAPLTAKELAQQKWTDIGKTTEFTPNQQLVVYLKITDMAGNVTYLSTNGLVVDNERPHEEFTAPEIVRVSGLTNNKIYNGDVSVKVSANDPVENGVYSGLKQVTYTVYNGTVYTATIAYQRDGLYTFDIDVTDKAGNTSADFTEQTFYVDTTAPTLEITGVADRSANNGDIIPVVSYSDTNYDDAQVSITLTGAMRKGVALDGSYADQHNGKVFTFKNFAKEKEVDDIYTLAATLTDKAGNTTEKTILFSVNRFGSTYALSAATEQLNGSYVQTPQDVVVTETNPDALQNIRITLFKNNQTIILQEGTDYRIEVRGGNGQWYEYIYTVLAKNFADDGVYRLTFYSEDAAGNIAENTLDTKKQEIGFGVDKTKPNMVVTNLESDTTYPLENLTVSLSAGDNLLLQSVVVYLDDYSKAYKTWTAEEVAAIVANQGEFTFDIPGDSTGAHQVKIVCTDAAGNEQTEEITNFYVTTNLFVRYYNNKPLFFGSIAAVVVIAGVVIALAAGKKKKNDKEK